jgi:transmembrane sensor
MPTPLPIRTPDASALERWLAGESSPDESRLVSAWVLAEDHRRRTAEGLKTLDAAEPVAASDLDVLWRRVQAKYRTGPASAPVLRANDPPRRGAGPLRARGPARRWVPAAVSLAATGVLAAGAMWYLRPSPNDAAIAHTYATATGERAVVQLGDGSRVVLAPRSVLRVGSAFGQRERRVWLDGEAAFDVAHATGAPFIVQTGAINAHVLGTTFFVRHYAGDPATRVAVREGKVEVTGHAAWPSPVILAGGSGVDVTDSTALRLSSAEVAQYTGWIDGRLVFRNTPAPEVLAALRRWYGYEFRLADSALAGKVLTVALSTQSSRAALSSLKLLMNVDLQFVGDTVVLIPRQTPQPMPGSRGDRRERIGHNPSEVGR